MLAAIGTQATGCIISSDDGGSGAVITADWTFQDVNAKGQTTTTPCPVGYGTVALHTEEVDANDRPIPGTEVLDLFDCADGRGPSAPLAPAVYETWIEVTNGNGGALYAESLSGILDVRDVDLPFHSDIINNGGYFSIAWNLKGAASNRALTCADVASLSSIEISATLAGSQQAVADKFDCVRGSDFSAPVLQGNYVVSVAALNSADQALGPVQNLANKVMRDRNQVTDLGTVMLAIDGQ
ncbi:MAG TPA: hypothetical protein VN253_20040 [Kofleriaceae bacterium]|nr:hypothetical protein [Kofleriaceae bacterium]